MSHEDSSLSVLCTISDVIAIPLNFLSGFILGLIVPVAVIAAMVAGIRFFTGQVPFLGDISEDEEGRRHLSFGLVSPDQAKVLFGEQKVQIGSEISQMKAEIQAIIEEARAEAEGAALEESQEPPAAA